MEDSFALDIPNDIFDLCFTEPNEETPYVDLANTGLRRGLPHRRVVRQMQTEVGRSQGPRDGDGLEAAIDAALSPIVLKGWYTLRALGLSAGEVENYLTRALHESKDLNPILKDGRRKCIPYFDVPSHEYLRSFIIKQYSDVRAKPFEAKKELVNEILAYTEAISRAKRRLARLNIELYKNQKLKRGRKYRIETEKAIRYRTDLERPRGLIDGVFVALLAGIDPSSFWQDYSFSRYIYNSAIPLGYNLRDIQWGYTGQQLYTLHRICNHKFPENMNSTGEQVYGVIEGQNFIRRLVDLKPGLESFNRQAERILSDIGICRTIDLDAWRVEILFEKLCGDRMFILF